MAIDRDEFKRVLIEKGCNFSAVARHFGFTTQYACAHAKELGLEIKKTVVDRASYARMAKRGENQHGKPTDKT